VQHISDRTSRSLIAISRQNESNCVTLVGTAPTLKVDSYELETLAVVETLQRFRVYILGKPFRLVADCSAIAKVKVNKELIPQVARL